MTLLIRLYRALYATSARQRALTLPSGSDAKYPYSKRSLFGRGCPHEPYVAGLIGSKG
ncbi:MAG: hypothetical protein QOC72_808 [Methylobacteriaceae bacterium]|nr:hypothetical protein [Methylobacteriaceae bacterium]